jgi:hypothetical protein
MRKTVKKISVRLTQEQLDFLTLDGGVVSEGIKEAIDLVILLANNDAKEDTINTSVGQITQTNTNNLIWE